jgi:hypothetical protein
MTEVKHYMDAETEAETLTALARDLAAMPARIARAREMEREATDKAAAAQEVHRVEAAAHAAAIDEAVARHKAEVAKREREIVNRENALIIREREVQGEWARVSAKEHAVNNRALDLNNRLHGIGAA